MRGELAAAYSRSGPAWRTGPERVYDVLAEFLVDRCPAPMPGALVLDLGAGTGAGGRVSARRGARVVSVDLALGMMRAGGTRLSFPVVGDAARLPFRPASFDAVVAAFSLNHLTDPVAGLRQAGQVLRPGGGLVAGVYAVGDGHPVKAATDEAAAAFGWVAPRWYRDLQTTAVPLLATVERAAAALAAAELEGRAEQAEVAVVGLAPYQLVAWRLGMAHLAPFVSVLLPAQRAALVADAMDRLGPGPPPLVRSIIVLVALAGRAAGSGAPSLMAATG